MSAPTSPAVTHPTWCDPRCCITIGTDVQHSSEPRVLRASLDDVEVTVAIARADGRSPDGRHLRGPIGITIDVRNTSGSTWADNSTMRADVLLTPAESIELASWLLGFASLADRAAAS